MKKLHISHTDLDGYGCQIVTKDLGYDYDNLDYDEVDKIPEIIKNYNEVLITDLNLKEDIVKQLKGNITIIDHHIWDYDYSKYNINIIVDNSKCATKLTAEYFKNESFIIDLINVYDLWKKDNKYFEIANLLNQWFYEIISSEDFINDNFKRIFLNKFFEIFEYKVEQLLEKYFEDYVVEELEIQKGMIFRNTILNFVKNESKTNKYLLAKAQFDDYKKFVEGEYCISNISSGIFQILSSMLLDENPNMICINYERRPNKELTGFVNSISIRSRNNKAREIAKLLGGGGHPNAAGAEIDLTFEELKQKLQELK